MRISTYLILAVMAGAVSCFNPYQEQEPAPSGGGGGKKTSAGVSVTALNTAEGGRAEAISNIIIKPVQIIVCPSEVGEKLK